MATSGQLRTYEVDDGTYFYVDWQQSSQNIPENYTDINWQLNIHCRWNYGSNALRSNGVNINGSNVYGGATYSGLGMGDHRLADGSIRIYHDNNGNKTFNINTSGWVIDGGDTSGSQNFTLNSIPRYATMNSATNFNDEQNPSFTFSNPANTTMSCWLEPKPNGPHLAERNFSGTSGTYTWELTEEERDQLRARCTDGNSCKCRIGLYSTLGSITQASYKDITMSIINANPQFNDFVFNDVNPTTIALTGNAKNNINGYSNIKADISVANKAVALKSATMVKYRFVIGNQNIDIPYSSSGNVTGTIEGAENGTYQVYAIDSRGNSTLVTKLANEVIQYEPIYINKSSSKVERNDSGVGELAILNYNGTIWNNNFGQVVNSVKSASYEYKETGSNTWITPSSPTDITPTLNNNNFSFNDLIRSNEQDYKFDLQKSYDFRITIEDELSTTTIQLTPMPSGVPNLCYADEGMAIMSDYDDSEGGALQVGGDTIIKGNIKLNGDFIVESGTNYIKFYDGTMICYGKDTGVNGGQKTVYFPEDFNEIPFFVATVDQLTTAYQITAQYGNLTKTSVDVEIHYGATDIGANAFTWIAIGKWK